MVLFLPFPSNCPLQSSLQSVSKRTISYSIHIFLQHFPSGENLWRMHRMNSLKARSQGCIGAFSVRTSTCLAHAWANQWDLNRITRKKFLGRRVYCTSITSPQPPCPFPPPRGLFPIIWALLHIINAQREIKISLKITKINYVINLMVFNRHQIVNKSFILHDKLEYRHILRQI